MEEMDVAQDDVGSYNIGSLIAHGSNQTEQTIQNAITTIYGTLEGERRLVERRLVKRRSDKRRSYGRSIGRDMIPLFGDIKERLFKKLFTETFIISACNFNNICLSSRVIENVHESNRELQNIFRRSLFFYNSIYDEEQAIYYSRLMLRLTQVFYYFYELEKYIKKYDTNYFSLYNDAYLRLNVLDPNQLYLIQIYTCTLILQNDDKQIEYIKSVLSGVTSILSNLDKIMQFIDASKDTIDIIQKVFEHFEKFIYFMNVVNANKSILEIDTVEASFGEHSITINTSVKQINLTDLDPELLGIGLHMSNLKDINNDIVIATNSEFEKMRNKYPSMEAELIQKYVTNIEKYIENNPFEFVLPILIEIIQSNRKITNAHILLFMILINWNNDHKILLVDFSCNDTNKFDEATCVLRAPPRKKSFSGLGVRKTNKNKQKKNLKKKTVNKRKKTKKRKSTYA